MWFRDHDSHRYQQINTGCYASRSNIVVNVWIQFKSNAIIISKYVYEKQFWESLVYLFILEF